MKAEFDRQFFMDRVSKSVQRIMKEPEVDGASDAAETVQQMAEKVCAELVGRDHRIACSEGCSHCCVVNVSILPPEAEAICNYLLSVSTEEELELLRKKLHALDLETRWLDDEERIMARKQCAFLTEAGSCSIYPVRPLLCRAMTSTDGNNCREALNMLALDEETPIFINLQQQEIFEAAFIGFSEALKSLSLEYRSLRLTGAVSQFMLKQLH